MLAQFRRFLNSFPAKVLLALIGLSFLFAGGRQALNTGAIGDAVVRAGDRTVNSAQFRSLFDIYRKNVAQQQQQQTGAPAAALSVEDAVKQGLDVRALDEVAYEEAMAALISREGVRVSDVLIGKEMRRLPQLFDPLSGKFDKKAYATFLQQNNLTAADFERSLRDQLAQTQMLTGLVAGLKAPAAFTALQAAFNHDGRVIETFALPASAVPPPPPPTDAQLQAFMHDNAKVLVRPASRQVTLVRFSAQAQAPTVTVDPAEVQKRYAFEKDTLSTPEKRTLVQIPLKAGVKADDVVARLRKSENAMAVADSLGVKPVAYTDAVRAAVPDPAVAAAAFSMSAGEVRAVVGGLGAAVVQVSKITPGHVVTLDEARPKLVQEVARYAAIKKATDLVQKYDDARSGGASLLDAAKAVGVKAQLLPPFDEQGRTPDGQQLPVPGKLVQTAYTLAQGADSDVLEAGQGQGEFYAIHLDKISPPSPLTLEEVRGPLTQRLRLQALIQALKVKADALADKVRKGQSMAAAAREAGATVTTGEVRRDTPDLEKSYSRELLTRLFDAKTGDVITAPDVKPGLVVARVGAPAPIGPLEIARASQALGPRASSAMFEDMAVHAREAARQIVKPKVDIKRARQALGVDPAIAPDAAPASAPVKPKPRP